MNIWAGTIGSLVVYKRTNEWEKALIMKWNLAPFCSAWDLKQWSQVWRSKSEKASLGIPALPLGCWESCMIFIRNAWTTEFIIWQGKSDAVVPVRRINYRSTVKTLSWIAITQSFYRCTFLDCHFSFFFSYKSKVPERRIHYRPLVKTSCGMSEHKNQ